MTIFQIKSILKQVLLLSGLVYLLFGRSIPGVSESTSVQFNSLCGSESTFPGQWIYEFENGTEASMSHRQHYGDGHAHIQQTLKTKCELEILRRDNSNERPWLESITRWVRSKGAMKYLLKGFNICRQIDFKNDFAADGPLQKEFIKVEHTEQDTTTSGTKTENIQLSGTVEDIPGASGVDTEHPHTAKLQEQATEAKDAPAIDEGFELDQTTLDNMELTMIDQIKIFNDPTKGQNQPEDEDSAKLRFKFYNELCKSCPYHEHVVRLVNPGDCYSLISKVTTNTRVTSRTKFDNHKAMCAIRWSGSVTRVVNQLQAGQQVAERLKDMSWNDAMMKAALLSICQEHLPFQEIVLTLSRPNATETFRECVDELQTVEGNSLPKKSYPRHGSARKTTDQQWKGKSGFKKKQGARTTFGKGASKGKDTPRLSPEDFKAKCAGEECKNFAKGKCKFSDEDCWRKHTVARAFKTRARTQDSRSWFDIVHQHSPNDGRAMMLSDGDDQDEYLNDLMAQQIEANQLEYEAGEEFFRRQERENYWVGPSSDEDPVGADEASPLIFDPDPTPPRVLQHGQGSPDLSSDSAVSPRRDHVDSIEGPADRSPEAGDTSSRPIVVSDSDDGIPQMAQLMMDDHDGVHSGSDANLSESLGSMLFRPQGQRPMASARMCRQMPPANHSMLAWQEHLPRRRHAWVQYFGSPADFDNAASPRRVRLPSLREARRRYSSDDVRNSSGDEEDMLQARRRKSRSPGARRDQSSSSGMQALGLHQPECHAARADRRARDEAYEQAKFDAGPPGDFPGDPIDLTVAADAGDRDPTLNYSYVNLEMTEEQLDEEVERTVARWEEEDDEYEYDEHTGRAAMLRRSPTAEAAVGRAMAARGTEVAYIDSAASSNFITAALVHKYDIDRLDADGLRVETAMEGEAVMKSLGKGSFSAQARGSEGVSPMFLGNASVLPNLRESLLSIGQLTQDGYALLFEGDSIVVMNATTREIILTSKRVGNLYPVVLSKMKLLQEDKISGREVPKALKTTAPEQQKAQFKSKCSSKISSVLTGQFDLGDATLDSHARPKSSSMKSTKTWDRPENQVIQKLFTENLQNLQDLTQDQAKLARARSPPKANFAQVCHERYNHTSIAKGSPLYKVLSQEFGKKFTDAPGFYVLCVFVL